ncbi:response regulator [bacterium]|nr:response regulator [bacterium]MBU1993570.1 response regulator [bacterium]
MKIKVLIIEDESIVALHIKKTVLLLGHQVLGVVKSGVGAFAIAEKNSVDLVISDINIQGEITGIECCSILQNKYNVSLIFITAYRDIETLKKASEVDFVGYLIKPFREDELETMLNLFVIKSETQAAQKKYILNDDYSYCFQAEKLFMGKQTVTLTASENKLLLALIRANGSIVSYNVMDYDVWNGESVSDGTRRQLIHRFKQKAPHFPIKLIRGMGYKLELNRPPFVSLI